MSLSFAKGHRVHPHYYHYYRVAVRCIFQNKFYDYSHVNCCKCQCQVRFDQCVTIKRLEIEILSPFRLIKTCLSAYGTIFIKFALKFIVLSFSGNRKKLLWVRFVFIGFPCSDGDGTSLERFNIINTTRFDGNVIGVSDVVFESVFFFLW